MHKRSSQEPTIELARSYLGSWAKQGVSSIYRFSTGSHHYVYDAILNDGSPVVIRMTTTSEGKAMAGAFQMNKRLHNMNIPVPKIYFSDFSCELPYLIMERLPGKDLEFVIKDLTDAELQLLAAHVMAIQKKVGLLPIGNGYGYSLDTESPPHTSWEAVLEQSIERSRTRILEVGFVDPLCIGRVRAAYEQSRPQLINIKAIPFLHDLTTKNVILHNRKLSGIVDTDDLCYGDPLFHIALTQMAVLSAKANLRYIKYLLDAYGPHSENLLNLYTAICCVDFLSELGLKFNGNEMAQSELKKSHLERIFSNLINGLGN